MLKVGDYAISKKGISGVIVEARHDTIMDSYTFSYQEVIPANPDIPGIIFGKIMVVARYLEGSDADFQKVGWQKMKEVVK
jgi:hypothetical protein